MESLEYELISGKKLKSTLLYVLSEKQLYKIKTKTINKTYYVCYQKNCAARIEILTNSVCCKPNKDVNQHTHGAVEDQYKEISCINEIREDCAGASNVMGEINAISTIRNAFKRVCEKYIVTLYLCSYDFFLFF